MNELQQKEFDIFRAFDEVCKTLSIPYFLVCGSALGAEKYQGFIPWDDDLDVGLYRADYERFLKEAPALLPSHLFLQTAETDAEFPQIYAKLRDSRTTYIERATAHRRMHHGIYIDLFVLDGYPSERRAAARLERRKRAANAVLLSATDIPRSTRAKLICAVLRLFGFHRRTKQTARRINRLFSRFPVEGAETVANHGNWQGTKEYAKKEHYGNGKDALFEGIAVRIPENIDAYLTQKYGAWREDLPEEEKRGHHTYTVCDTTRPYTHYLPK